MSGGLFQSPGCSRWFGLPDPKIFGEISVSIFSLAEKGDGNAFIKQSSVKRPQGLAEFPCIAVGDVALSMMQAGRFWVEVRGSCSDGDLYGYEVGEVLKMLRQTDAAGLPVTFAYSPCGKVTDRGLDRVVPRG